MRFFFFIKSKKAERAGNARQEILNENKLGRFKIFPKVILFRTTKPTICFNLNF